MQGQGARHGSSGGIKKINDFATNKEYDDVQ